VAAEERWGLQAGETRFVVFTAQAATASSYGESGWAGLNLGRIAGAIWTVIRGMVQPPTMAAERHTLQHADGFRPDAYYLVELDDHLLEQLGLDANGQPWTGGTADGTTTYGELALRGEAEDAAVLCSFERTYMVRAAEVSNAMVLTRPATDYEATKAALVGTLCAMLDKGHKPRQALNSPPCRFSPS